LASSNNDGWHVIRPGDTLQKLALRYLGSASRWQELYRLNPQIIEDPHWIYPGRRLRVRVDTPTAPHAQIQALARRVEERPNPVSWRSAASGDLLLERDGLRTYRGASAELKFDDGTAATLSEDSLVFIRRQTPPSAPISRKEIEIQLGQADLASQARPGAKAPEIEILVDGASNRAVADDRGRLQTRSRRTQAGAQFMQYAGTGEVTAAGAKVALAAGTGTVVPSRKPPQPAEALLPAPAGLEPAAGDELGIDDPVLHWNPVEGADHYVVEVCSDAECGAVLERQAEVRETQARLAEPLPEGGGHWRVTAVAASGLDGYPSPALGFVTVASVLPPAPRLTLTTPAGASLRSGACVSERPALSVDSTDRHGKALEWRLLVNGNPVEADPAKAFPWSDSYQVVATASDARGRAASSQPFELTLDQIAPSVDLPPAPAGEPIASPEYSRRMRLPKPGPTVAPCTVGLQVATAQDGPWLPIACGGAESEPTRLALSGDSATLWVRSAGSTLRLGELWPLDGSSALALSLGDRGCGLAEARLRIIPSPYQPGRVVLEVEADDTAGLSANRAWHVDPYRSE